MAGEVGLVSPTWHGGFRQPLVMRQRQVGASDCTGFIPDSLLVGSCAVRRTSCCEHPPCPTNKYPLYLDEAENLSG
jgi:hypothetical protein